MKTVLLIIVSGILFFSCVQESKDDEYPVIDMTGEDSFPKRAVRGKRRDSLV